MGGKIIMCEMDTEQIIEEIKRLKQENTELKGKIDGYIGNLIDFGIIQEVNPA